MKTERVLHRAVAIAAFMLAVLTGRAAHAQPPLGSELILNTGFESGLAPWFGLGGASIAQTGADPFAGSSSMSVTNRDDAFDGPGVIIPGSTPDGVYQTSAWVRIDAPGQHRIQITFKKVDAAGTNFTQAADLFIEGQSWVQVRGWYTLNRAGTLTELLMYVEGPEPGVSFRVDEASMRRVILDPNWRADADARIEQLRKGDAVVRVVDTNGQPVAGAQVSAQQVSKSFPFGTALAAGALGIPQYRQFVIDNFNYAVAENAMKWDNTQPGPQSFTFANADAMVDFCADNNIPIRGHNVFWAVEQFVPGWVRSLNNQQLAQAVSDRVDSIVVRYRNIVTHWDVNNEMLHGNFFESRLGTQVRADMFNMVKAADPAALTFVNDFNIITAGDFFAYIDQINQLEALGATIDGVGVQGHFVGQVDPPSVLARLDILAQLNKPIWVSEFDAEIVDKNLRADAYEDFYRLAYSHPAVEGILMWGFWEGAHWRPDAAIVD
ncbi:MAG: endo-1,4-beta-xylanase, partial [Planctomycetota bacterium]